MTAHRLASMEATTPKTAPCPAPVALKPCPFCGGEATPHANDWCDPPEWSVHCSRCFAGIRGNVIQADAIAAWDRRVDPRQPIETVPKETKAVTPGAALRAAIAKKGWLQADLADVIQAATATVSDICCDRRGISYRMAHRLAAAFSNDAAYWASVQSAHDLRNSKPPKPGIVERREALIARKKAAADPIEEPGRVIAHAPNPNPTGS